MSFRVPFVAIIAVSLHIDVSSLQISSIENFGNFRTNILFGIKSQSTSGKEPFREAVEHKAMVNAQLATWGKNISREYFIIVGGEHDDGVEGLSTTLMCGDTMDDIACKEAVLIERASDRINATTAEWLVVTEDDHFLFTDSYVHLLSNYDPNTPQVLTHSWGCGQLWEHRPESRNGTLPRPRGVPKRSNCDAVARKGGICSGLSGYVVSRGALKMIHAKKHTGSFIEQFLSSSDPRPSRGRRSDMAASCFFYEQGIPQIFVEEEHAKVKSFGFHGNTEAEQDAEIDRLVRSSKHTRPLSIHFAHRTKRNIPEYIAKVADVLRPAARSSLGMAAENETC
eukprot:gnl/TRDRNA2_/TRDRNA2_193290_c0_seq1.p1 gnl/TRDRNA2_/TRDRNA2_193290_c0~~gnl/TRDRNA2_/TRDRNA2_193290_c0_seq1.p1  ORF type:complete len:352 (-),score=27.40 gnl/TRDRNA2_/TRDRNA2_193290_c0_seq1:96-1112(-)